MITPRTLRASLACGRAARRGEERTAKDSDVCHAKLGYHYCTISYHDILYDTVFYHDIRYDTIRYDTITYHTTVHYANTIM